MKIYIMCDLEGTAGVIDQRKQCWFDGEYYRQARQLATLELSALVQGALEGGASHLAGSRESESTDPGDRPSGNEQDQGDQTFLSRTALYDPHSV